MDGEAQAVISSYESAMSRGDRDANQKKRSSATKSQFVEWEIESPRSGDRHILADLEPVTITLKTDVHEDIKDGLHGLALYNHEEQLIWAWNSPRLQLAAGRHDLRHNFPILPLRPGLYNWLATLYDGGELLDWWHAVPEMTVSIRSYQSSLDAWQGILNVPDNFETANNSLPQATRRVGAQSR